MLLALAWTVEEEDRSSGSAAAASAAAASAAARGPSQLELNQQLKVIARGWRITGLDKMAEREAFLADKRCKELSSQYEQLAANEALSEDEASAMRNEIRTAVERTRELERALAVANRHKVRAELVEYQHRTGFMLADMVSLMLGLDDSMSEDRSEKGIDDVQFYAAMTRRFGYRGTPWVLSSVFRSIDAE